MKYNESRVGSSKFSDGQGIMLVVGALVFVPVLVVIASFMVIVLVVMPSMDGPTLLLLVGIGLFLSVVVVVFVKYIRFYTDPFDHKVDGDE